MIDSAEEYAKWIALHPDKRVPGDSKQSDAWATAMKMIDGLTSGDA